MNFRVLPSYGPICSHNIGKETFITINNGKLAQTILDSPYCINRPKMFKIGANANPDTSGFTLIDGSNPAWKAQRRLSYLYMQYLNYKALILINIQNIYYVQLFLIKLMKKLIKKNYGIHVKIYDVVCGIS